MTSKELFIIAPARPVRLSFTPMTPPVIRIALMGLGIAAALLAGMAWGRQVGRLVMGLLLVVILLSVFAYSRSRIVPYHADAESRAALLTGDEPDYLLTAISLARDHDINVDNNILRRDYQWFQDRPVGGGDFDFFNRISKGRISGHRAEWGSARYMQHRPGISAVVAPVFLVSPHHFRWAVYLLISCVLVAFAGMSWLAARRMGVEDGVAWVACLGCVLAPPVLFYANQIYPEAVAGCLLAGAALLIMMGGRLAWLAVPALVAVVWFSDRALPVFAALATAALLGQPSWRSRGWMALVLVADLFLFGLYCQHRFGQPLPISHNEVFDCSVALAPRRMFQILFDSRQGWVWLFPPVLLLPALAWTLFRQRPLPVVPLTILAALLLNLAMIASFGDWRGGTNPRGRYYVIPQLLMVPLLFHWFRSSWGGIDRVRVGWFIGLLALALVPVPWLVKNPAWWFRLYHPFYGWESIQWFYVYLPSLPDDASRQEWVKVLAWMPLLIVPSVACIWVEMRRKT